MNAKRLSKGLALLTALYGIETWNMGTAGKRRLNAMNLRFVRSMNGLSEE